jgi:hypothetical protein
MSTHGPIGCRYVAVVLSDVDRSSGRSRVLDVDRLPATRLVNLAVKVALVASFAVAIGLSPDTVDGKAMGFRAPLFLAPAVFVPIAARVRRWEPYPHTADALLSAPFLIDTLGNLFGVYDEFPQTTGGLIGSLLAVRWLGPRTSNSALRQVSPVRVSSAASTSAAKPSSSAVVGVWLQTYSPSSSPA